MPYLFWIVMLTHPQTRDPLCFKVPSGISDPISKLAPVPPLHLHRFILTTCLLSPEGFWLFMLKNVNIKFCDGVSRQVNGGIHLPRPENLWNWTPPGVAKNKLISGKSPGGGALVTLWHFDCRFIQCTNSKQHMFVDEVCVCVRVRVCVCVCVL